LVVGTRVTLLANGRGKLPGPNTSSWPGVVRKARRRDKSRLRKEDKKGSETNTSE